LRIVSQNGRDKLPAFLQSNIGELLETFRSGEIAVLEQAGTLAAIVLLRFSTKVLPEVGRIEDLSKCSIVVVGRWAASLDWLVAVGV
jgi:hypothetical protein